MKDYTIYVTEEIARKAMEKGFECEEGIRTENFKPIAYFILESNIKIGDYIYYKLPTAEQICGWLREKKYLVINISRTVLQSDENDEDYNLRIVHTWDGGFMSDVMKSYNYEDLLLKGIAKALDLI